MLNFCWLNVGELNPMSRIKRKMNFCMFNYFLECSKQGKFSQLKKNKGCEIWNSLSKYYFNITRLLKLINNTIQLNRISYY